MITRKNFRPENKKIYWEAFIKMETAREIYELGVQLGPSKERWTGFYQFNGTSLIQDENNEPHSRDVGIVGEIENIWATKSKLEEKTGVKLTPTI